MNLSEMTLDELWELFPIILEEHNTAYVDWYAEEKNNLLNCIQRKNIKRINHIGSSAVKGLISKPTIDILLEIDKESDTENLKYILDINGWILMFEENEPDFKIVFNKGYTPEGFAPKVYHLHIRYFGDCDELYFRDYLLARDDVAKDYGNLKLELIKQYKHDRDGYTKAKTEFVLKHTQKARKEFGDKYSPES